MSDDAVTRGILPNIHEGNNAESEKKALKHLKKYAKGKKTIPVPFAQAESVPFALKDADMKGAQHDKVTLKDLYATQPSVKTKKVKRFIKQDGNFSPIPTIVKVKDKYYVANGHHRATADFFLGKKSIKANVMDIT